MLHDLNGPPKLMLTLFARDRRSCTHPMGALSLRAVAAYLGVHAVSVLPTSQVWVTGHIGGWTAAVVVLQVWRRHAVVAAAHRAWV
jgi:hypothetical protein